MQKSYMPNPKNIKKQWYIMDATDQVLGRLAVKIVKILMGKHLPWYTAHLDMGDFIVVTNVEKIKVTGEKQRDKIYYFWSGYPGGLKERSTGDILKNHPDRLLRLAVRRMLPKSVLGHNMLKKLKVYAGPNHPHQAQCPKVWKKEAVSLKQQKIV